MTKRPIETPLLTANAIDLNAIARSAGARSAQQGRTYYMQGRVQLVEASRTEALLKVRGSMPYPYSVEVWVEQDEGTLLSCSCPYAAGYSSIICKHMVAAAIALQAHLRYHPPDTWKTVLDRAMLARQQRQGPAARRLLCFSLQRLSGWALQTYTLPARLLPADISEDPGQIPQLLQRDAELAGDLRMLSHASSAAPYVNATPAIMAAVRLLGMAYSNYYASYAGGPMGATYDQVFALLAAAPVFLGDQQRPLRQPLTILLEQAQIEAQLETSELGLSLNSVLKLGDRQIAIEGLEVVLQEPPWLLAGTLLFRLTPESQPFLSLLKNPELEIPREEQGEFLNGYLQRLARQLPLGGASITWEDVSAQPQPRLYLREQERELLAELRFGYGDYELPYDRKLPQESVQPYQATLKLGRIQRDPGLEQQAFQELSGHGLKRGPEAGIFLLRANTTPAEFLLQQLPRLAQRGFEVFGEHELRSARVNRNKPSISFKISSGIDWFDVQAVISFGDVQVSLKEVRRSLRKRERYIKLADGTIGELPEQWLSQYRHLFGLAEETEQGLRVAQHHMTLLDQLLTEPDRVRADQEFTRRRQRLRDFSTIAEQPLPQRFSGELRPYQKAGFDWLHFLHEYHFGGCLADDMGTGKTITTLAFLLSLRERGHANRADLLVMPRSLIFNWEREAQRFAPGLRLLVHADPDRPSDTASFDQHDLVLTTYGIMRRDIELLRQYQFHYLVLDESQAIKNPLAETSKAARLLRGDHHLALTGTPVENSTAELWSQFAFLNPGLLGNLEYFRKEFASPIERGEDEQAAQSLRRLVYPFILRRTKDQVAADLPPRSERIVECAMEPAQRKLYNKQRDYYRSLLLGMIEQEGMQDARMKVLEGLLRLRQICNHPQLVEPRSKAGSAKLELLLETLETLQAEGHKALVFSQFVGMLTLVRQQLDARAIAYSYLDGRAKDRQSRVDTFQNDPQIPFFLISLKAGGVGLNLTAADYVIHIDPWWNPAVEMQATDRSHRIGQDKPVFVYKLIARDSVEEKILQLQERKRALVSQLIGSESSFFKTLTRDDVEVLFS